jgi:thiaminase
MLMSIGMAKALCSRRNDTKGVLHFNDLQTNILHELEMHKELSASLGIDLQKVKPLPATQLYVEFLDHTSASSNSVANICASMVPCMSLYAFIGKRAIENGLCIELDSNRWVKEYSSEGFQSYAVGLETLLDVYAETEGKSIDDLQSFYRSAMELEYAFFNALEFRSWSGLNPATFLVDFDETISLDETIALICQAHKQHEDASSKYELLLLQYLNSYRSFIKEHIPSSDQRNTFDRNVVDDFLSKYTAFETSMLGPVEESGILSNLTQSQLTAIGESVHTRVSVFYVLKHALRRMNRSSSPAFIDVVTLNWSRDVVQASCALHLDDLKHRVRVHSNDLEWDVNTGLSTGLISKVMTGPTHKVGTQRHLTSGCGEGLHVFVGDSLGDLGALLETDIGILVGNKESMQRHCKVFGIELQLLERFVVRMTEEGGATAALKNTNGKTPILYLADSWAHIGFCLFGKPFISEWLANQRQASTVCGGIGLRMPTVLSVAGSDSGGGAGIQADMKACSACGVFSATAITALTAQNTIGVTAVEAVSPSMLTAQLEAVLSDIAVDVIKSGMLPNEASAQLLTRAAISHAVAHVVVDPVMVTSSGSRLMPPEGKSYVSLLVCSYPLSSIRRGRGY